VGNWAAQERGKKESTFPHAAAAELAIDDDIDLRPLTGCFVAFKDDDGDEEGEDEDDDEDDDDEGWCEFGSSRAATLSLVDSSFLLFFHTLTHNTTSAIATTNAATEIPATAPPESPIAATCLDAKPSKNPD